MKKIFQSVLNLIFPLSCEFCNRDTNNQYRFCDFCLNDINYTPDYNNIEQNITESVLYGKIPHEFSFSLFYFEEGKVSQKIIHSIKYKSNKNLGVLFGLKIGLKLKRINKTNNFDVIVPVPIHHKRKFNRGYNQAEIIANSLGKSLKIKVYKKFVKKTKNSKSQTKVSASQRINNNENSFTCKNIYKAKHILIVDDVITTGSTIENICKSIYKSHPHIKISIVSLAISKSNK